MFAVCLEMETLEAYYFQTIEIHLLESVAGHSTRNVELKRHHIFFLYLLYMYIYIHTYKYIYLQVSTNPIKHMFVFYSHANAFHFSNN